MSAMHWEARRRQSAMERRAAHRQQLLREDGAPGPPSAPGSDVSELVPSLEHSDVDQCPHCKSSRQTPSSSGKVSHSPYSTSSSGESCAEALLASAALCCPLLASAALCMSLQLWRHT